MPRKPILRIEGLVKTFKHHRVLDGIDLGVDQGETVCVLGPSGSGKSTMLRCVNWLEVPDGGAIYLDDQRVGVRADGRRAMSDSELATVRARMGMVFQSFALWPHLNVLQNVMAAPVNVQRRPKAFVREEAMAMLEKVGLAAKAAAYPSQLSGGQKQRVGIARALVMQPQVMLFDEPTSALDPERVDEVLRVIRQLAQDGMTMLVVTHEMAFARDVANRIAFLDGGKVVELATPRDFFQSPQTDRARQFVKRFTDGG